MKLCCSGSPKTRSVADLCVCSEARVYVLDNGRSPDLHCLIQEILDSRFCLSLGVAENRNRWSKTQTDDAETNSRFP